MHTLQAARLGTPRLTLVSAAHLCPQAGVLRGTCLWIDFPFPAFPENMGHWAEVLLPVYSALVEGAWAQRPPQASGNDWNATAAGGGADGGASEGGASGAGGSSGSEGSGASSSEGSSGGGGGGLSEADAVLSAVIFPNLRREQVKVGGGAGRLVGGGLAVVQQASGKEWMHVSCDVVRHAPFSHACMRAPVSLVPACPPHHPAPFCPPPHPASPRPVAAGPDLGDGHAEADAQAGAARPRHATRAVF